MFEFLFKYPATTFSAGTLGLASSWPLWLLVFSIVLAAGPLGWRWYRNRQYLGPGRSLALWSLQCLMVALLALMLWQPVLRLQQAVAGQNLVALLLDTSASMRHQDTGVSRLHQAQRELEGGLLSELGQNFQVELFSFAAEPARLENLQSLPAPGETTHLVSSIEQVLQQAKSAALSAVIVISDGGEKEELSTTDWESELAAYAVPVHSIGVGREQIPEDAELSDVLVSSRSLPGMRQSAQVVIRQGSTATARVKVYDGDQVLASEELQLPPNTASSSHRIEFSSGDRGIKDLRFVLDAEPEDPNRLNQTQSRVLNVTATPRRILYIEGEPRWEYKFIRRAIDGDPIVELVSLLQTSPNKYYRQGISSADELAAGFPTDRESLFKYDAVIIGSLPATALSDKQHRLLLDYVGQRGGALMLLAGRQGLGDGGWGRSALAGALPVRLPDRDEPGFKREYAQVEPSIFGAEMPMLRLAETTAQSLQRWTELPAIADYQWVGDLKAGAIALLTANIGTQQLPLLSSQRYGKGQTMVLATSGTWRWQMQMPSEDQTHETFWRQLLHSLAAETPEQLTLGTDRSYYASGDLVRIKLNVLDQAYEPAFNANVSAKITDSRGQQQTLNLQPNPTEPGSYEAFYDTATAGIHRVDAEVMLGDRVMGANAHYFMRGEQLAEHYQIQQNRVLLERIAQATGGQYWRLEDLAGLPQQLQFSSAGIRETKVLSLWNMPILFLVLLAFKLSEWLLRRRWGRL